MSFGPEKDVAYARFRAAERRAAETLTGRRIGDEEMAQMGHHYNRCTKGSSLLKTLRSIQLFADDVDCVITGERLSSRNATQALNDLALAAADWDRASRCHGSPPDLASAIRDGLRVQNSSVLPEFEYFGNRDGKPELGDIQAATSDHAMRKLKSGGLRVMYINAKSQSENDRTGSSVSTSDESYDPKFRVTLWRRLKWLIVGISPHDARQIEYSLKYSYIKMMMIMGESRDDAERSYKSDEAYRNYKAMFITKARSQVKSKVEADRVWERHWNGGSGDALC
jgi:hypothetical protein